MSRGAERVCFCERSRPALAALKLNLDRLQAGPEAVIVPLDLWRHGVRPPPTHVPLDLVFLDPPFEDCRDLADHTRIGTLLSRLGASGAVSPDTLVVLRHERRVDAPAIIGGYWQPVERREYGRSVIDFLAWRAPDAPASQTPPPEPSP